MSIKTPLTAQRVVEFLISKKGRSSKREMNRFFGLEGEEEKKALKNILKTLERQGVVRRKERCYISRVTETWIGANHDNTPYEQTVCVVTNNNLMSVDRRFRRTFYMDKSFPFLQKGDVVLVDTPNGQARRPSAIFVKKLGCVTDAGMASLISIYDHHLPIAFSSQALQEARLATLPQMDGRTDLRHLPFVTIDGADARDFDDAVLVEPDTSSSNKGGWHIYVAIADVAYFVRPNSALDSDAYERGNSTYFPDRVLPMLPEELSNNLCSLMPDEDRPCLVAECWIDKDGQKKKHHFGRAMIRSAARLTYEQVENDFRGTHRLENLTCQMDALKGAYHSLAKAREARGVMELDVPELRVVLENDKVVGIRQRPRYDSHRVIEELMILANVSAAQTLEKLGMPIMYRVHDKPSDEKLLALNIFLQANGLKKHIKDNPRPHDFNDILKAIEGKPAAISVNEMVLRSQSQAEYSPNNIGHFGLALDSYGHFTSPIRRYADVMIHRALITGLKMGDGGLTESQATAFEKIGTHISATERQSAAAEEDALDRYVASFLSGKLGMMFDARITSITSCGIFVRLDEYGADGLVTISSLTDDHYLYDDKYRIWRGKLTGRTFKIGQAVDVLLKDVVPVTGGLLFDIIDTPKPKRPKKKKKPSLKQKSKKTKS